MYDFIYFCKYKYLPTEVNFFKYKLKMHFKYLLNKTKFRRYRIVYLFICYSQN